MSERPGIVDTARALNCLPERSAGDKLVSGNCPSGHESKGGRCFFIYPDTDSFYCQHCHAGGDSYELIKLARNCEFKEAAAWAKEVGLIQDNGFKESLAIPTYKILTEAVRFFHSQLPDPGRKHLRTHYGLTDETVDKYFIGYAPKDFSLIAHLKEKYSIEDIEKTGLLSRGQSFFQGQIIFPYWQGGYVRYLIGRQTKATPSRKKGKYEKLPVNDIVKNAYFYGEDSIKNADIVYVTEGVTDCLSALQCNLPSISPVTTQFRKSDYPKLMELVKGKTVYLIPDNETNQAGMTGAISTQEFLTKNHVKSHIITLPMPEGSEKIDLNEYLRDNSLKAFTELVSEQVEREGEQAKNSILHDVKGWVDMSAGNFYGIDIDRDLLLVSKEAKANRRQILHRMCKEKILERLPGKNGLFRKIEKDLNIMSLDDNCENDLGLRWPFGIEEYCYFYENSIACVAGSKDSGKTAYLLNLAAINADTHKIYYFNSEMGKQELVNRLKQFGLPLDWWKERVTFVEGITFYNVQDKIIPDAINIIDYLEETERSFEIGIKITEIRNKLTTGSAIIGLQKNKGQAYARGGEATQQKARIYLTMDSGELKIMVGKLWKTDRNPKGVVWRYKLVGGYNFIIQ